MTTYRPRSNPCRAFVLLLTIILASPAILTASGGPITADFRSMGTFFTEELVLGGLTVRNESSLGPISIFQYNGLGTYYSRLDRHFYVQIGDEVEFDFSAIGGVTELTLNFSGSQGPNSYTVELDRYFVGNPNPVTISYGGESAIRHIGLPSFAPLERLVLRPTGSTVRVGSITYTPVPEPKTIALVAPCLLLLLIYVPRRLSAFRACGCRTQTQP